MMWLAGMPQLALLMTALLQFAAASTRQHQHDGTRWAPLANDKYYYETNDAASTLQAGRTRKIAIIGAGPSGTSAAYYLKRAQDRLASGNFSATAEALDITIYERENRIGGRVAVVYPHDDDTHDPIELGASIFADVNLNLRRAVKQFKLETGAHMGMDGQMGIWDGQQFLFEGDQSSWWTSAKFFLRYGYSAITTESIVKKQLAAFGALYRPSFLHARSSSSSSSSTRSEDEERDGSATASGYPWTSIERLADAVNASALAATTGMQFFKERRVSELFIEEMVEAATRVNYAQDTDQIHGFGALVSLAASGATGVKQGNYRIFEEFARRSGARVLTGVQGHVTGILKLPKPSRGRRVANNVQWYVGAKSGEGEVYDAVIIATSWHNADITLLNTPERVKAKPFVHLHVTLLTTTRASPRPEYFGLGSQDVVPRTILTSDESVRRAQDKRKPAPEPQDPGAEPPSLGDKLKTPKHDFFSLNYLRSIERTTSSKEKEFVVKIFSAEPMTDSTLDQLFGRDTITWLRRHEWDSYPYLSPTERFPAVQIDEGLVYPNAMESLVSTMETSTIAARNAVALLLERWYGAEFVHGSECRFEQQSDPIDNPNWAGWGCDAA